MTAPINILAAALDKVQLEPAACSLPSRVQAERAALLVIAQLVDVTGQPPQQSSSPLLHYVQEVDRAKEILRRAMEQMDQNDQSANRDALVENFERAQDVYYQATASVAELVARMIMPARVRSAGVDSVWAEGYF